MTGELLLFFPFSIALELLPSMYKQRWEIRNSTGRLTCFPSPRSKSRPWRFPFPSFKVRRNSDILPPATYQLTLVTQNSSSIEGRVKYSPSLPWGGASGWWWLERETTGAGRSYVEGHSSSRKIFIRGKKSCERLLLRVPLVGVQGVEVRNNMLLIH